MRILKFLIILIITIGFMTPITNVAWAGIWQNTGGPAGDVKFAADGTVWVNNSYNLAKYNGSTWSYTPDIPYKDTTYINYFAIDGSNNIWISTCNRGGRRMAYIYKLVNNNWVFQASKDCEYSVIQNMFFDSNNNLWFELSNSFGKIENNEIVDIAADVFPGRPIGTTSNYLCGSLADREGRVWGVHSADVVAYWEEGTWHQVSGNRWDRLFIGNDGKVWRIRNNTGLYYWSGSSWVLIKGFDSTPYLPDTAVVGPDGSIWYSSGTSACRWNGESLIEYSNIGSGDVAIAPDGCIWKGGSKKYVPDSNEFNLVPSSNGPTGKFIVKGDYGNSRLFYSKMQISTDGSSFTDWYDVLDGATYTITPSSNSYWFRLKWQWQANVSSPLVTKYTNSYKVDLITTNPNINSSTQVVTWDQTRGCSKINLSWSPITNATGYNLYIFDGNTYRKNSIGNVTSWDSQSAKIFPFASELPENNSISTDIFRWDASGLDLEDTPIRLYRSTIGTGHDNDKTYYFRITAYNQWMESDFEALSARQSIQLPNATDNTAPSGTISVTVPDGATAPANVTINLSAVTDFESGLHQMRFSNDGSSYSSWQNFSTTKSWTTSAGEGEKTVYAQVNDKVGNVKTFSVTFWLGATLTQIYNESLSSAQKSESARIAAEEAKISANEAKDSANAARDASIMASDIAREAKDLAGNAANQTFYSGAYGGNSESVADVAGYIRNTQLPDIENMITSLQSDVTNIKTNLSASDTTPPYIKSVKGYRNATCTTESTFKLVIEASDNNSGVEFRAKADTGSWTSWTSNNPITVSGITGTGAHVIDVEVRDSSGNVTTGNMTVFKI